MVAGEIQEPCSGTEHTNFTCAGVVPISYHGRVVGLAPANDSTLHQLMGARQVQEPQALPEHADLGGSVAIPIPHHRNIASLSPANDSTLR